MLRTYEEIYSKILPVMQQTEESERTTKAGRKPKISSAPIATLFIISYITNTPVLTLAQFLIDHKLKSYHIFLSGWRKGITLLTYLYAYALVYSFFRKKDILACA